MSSEKVVPLMEYQVGPEGDLFYKKFIAEFNLILGFLFNFGKLKFTFKKLFFSVHDFIKDHL